MRIWKKTLKITSIIIVSIILFMVLLVFGAKMFESQLASFAIEKLEGEIDAPMSIGKVSLIPLFSFPRLSAEINNFWIGDPKSKNGDTLLFIHSLKVGLDTWDLIDGIYTIDEMKISGLDFDYIIDKKGQSNIDFLIYAFGDTTAASDTIPVLPRDVVEAPLDLTAEKLSLENIRINYYDSLANIGSQVYIPEITMKAKTKNDIYTGKTEGGFILSNMLFEDTKVDQMKSCTVKFELEYEDGEATIKKLLISSEGINLGMEGILTLSDTLSVDARLEARVVDFNILKKYIPKDYTYLFENTNSGKVAASTVNLEMEFVDDEVWIKNLLFKSEGIDLGMNGTFRLSDTIAIDANVQALSLNFDILNKFIPHQYIEEYGIINIGGKADISASIKGQYAVSTLLPTVKADVNLKNISLNTKDYPEIRTLNLEANITNGEKSDMSEAVVNIRNLTMNTAASSVQLEGTVNGIENPKYSFRSLLVINLAEFKSYIPDSLAKNVQGNIRATIKTSGILPETIPNDFADYVLDRTTLSLNFSKVSGLLIDSLQVDNFSAGFSYSPQYSGDKNININNLNLKSEVLNIDLQKSSVTAILKGRVSDPLKMAADIQSFRIQNGNNLMSGSADIKNFEVPEFDINTNITLKLEELIAFAPDSMINNMSGSINANIQLKGKIHPDSVEAQIYPLIFENSSFGLTFNNVTLLFPDSTMDVQNISGKMSLENDELRLNDFSGIYNKLSFEADSTIVQNIYKAVLLNQKEELYVKTRLKLGDIFYDDFKYLMDTDTTNVVSDTSTNSTITDVSQNWTFLIHGSASVNKFVMDSTVLEGYKINRLHLDDMSTLFKLTDSSYIFDQFKFKAFEGVMNNSFHYKLREDGKQSVSSHNVVKNMNIRTLLRDLDNFGMDSLITYNNLSGRLSSDLNMFIPIDDSALIDKMMISGDLTLEEGGVYNYGPAEEMSKFTRIKELDNIQFKTLRSNIFMFKNKLYVPRTNIVSNALDIAAFGMQSMENDYEYHLEIHLSNILFGKSKKRNKKQDKSGEEIDEKSLKKSSHKVRYADIEGDSKAGWDTKASREEMMNKIRVQQKMLNFIFFPKNIHYNTEVDKKI